MAIELKFAAETEANRIAWNHVSSRFAGGCALPSWGPFGECANEDLLGNLDGKNVLEVGCGSGHSLAYIARSRAAKIFGLDFSYTAIDLAKETNRQELASGRVTLFEMPMERRAPLRDIDVCFSIQAIGWTLDPASVFANIAGYLKPGGLFVWSWGHPITSKVRYQSGQYVIADSYFNDAPHREVGWPWRLRTARDYPPGWYHLGPWA
jgi:SAM-dependent methyltransferase